METRLEIIKRYLEEDPHDPFLNYVLALEFSTKEKFSEALELLSEVIRKNPDYLAAYYQAGLLAEKTGNIIRAKQYYTEGIKLARFQNDTHTLSELNTALDGLED